jgi:pyruvate/2-oxoglutarate dehydrogenase complex dihydrolipoamide acyltransferase (E2) component
VSESRITWRMPHLGNGVDTAVIQEWLVDVGEPVREGEPVVIVETDKATSDLEAPITGTLLAIMVEEGTEVEVGNILAEFGAEGS